MKIRVYKENLQEILKIENEQFHYLNSVMRQKIGSKIYIFNSNEGEFLYEITEIEKKFIICKSIYKVKEFQESPINLTYIFSIIKTKNIELLIQKCTEIGVHKFIPLITERTENTKIHIERLQKIAIEASEQCGRLDIPEILPTIKMKDLPKLYKPNEPFILLHQDGTSNLKIQSNKISIITGCEGGFTENELLELEKFTIKAKISENILRAETAGILGCGIFINSIH